MIFNKPERIFKSLKQVRKRDLNSEILKSLNRFGNTFKSLKEGSKPVRKSIKSLKLVKMILKAKRALKIL